MRMNTDALVVKVSDTGESDRVVTLLTRDYGLLRAFANGSKKVKSRLHSRTQTLCCSRFSIYKSRDSYIIDDAQEVEMFFGLRENIEKISLAQYFCELALELAPEFDPAEDYLRLILNALHLLEKEKRPRGILKAAYELRILTLSGYMPALSGCGACGCEESGLWIFNPGSGDVQCEKCGGIGVAIGNGVLTAMRHACLSDIERVYNFALPGDSVRLLAQAAEQYTLAQTRRSYKSLVFYNDIDGGIQ